MVSYALLFTIATFQSEKVLILVVVDNGLVHATNQTTNIRLAVLILVVVDNGLVHGMCAIRVWEGWS